MTVVQSDLEEPTSSSAPLTSRVAVGVRWGVFDQIIQQGTTFVVRLPALDPAARRGDDRAEANATP